MELARRFQIRNPEPMGTVGTNAEGVAQACHTDVRRIDRLRFVSAKRMSLELTKTISDASYRNGVLRHIIEFSMTANDLEASRVPVQGIHSEPVRQELLLAYPTPRR